MTTEKRLVTLILLFLSVFYGVPNTKSSLAETSSKITQRNPFGSLLPENKNSVKRSLSLLKSTSIKKRSSIKKKEALRKKVLKKKVLAKVVSQVSELQPPVEIDISSRVKQLTRILQLKDILETSEGPYAFIDEKKVSYIVQEGEWLDSVFVRNIYKKSVELQEIDGETTIVLVLQP